MTEAWFFIVGAPLTVAYGAVTGYVLCACIRRLPCPPLDFLLGVFVSLLAPLLFAVFFILTIPELLQQWGWSRKPPPL